MYLQLTVSVDCQESGSKNAAKGIALYITSVWTLLEIEQIVSPTGNTKN